MMLRSWQRDLDVEAAVARRAACTHAVDAHIRSVRVIDGGPMDDHVTELVYCNDCDRYLFATNWRTRRETEYTPLSDTEARAERKRERDDLAERLHRPGRIFA